MDFTLALIPIAVPQSPFRDFVCKHKGKLILLVALEEDKARKLASEYGYQNIVSTKELADLYYDKAEGLQPLTITGRRQSLRLQ